MRILIPLCLCLPLAVFAQDKTSLSSDWMDLVKGEKSKSLGLELRDIEPGDEKGTRKVTLAVPKKSISDPDSIEEVVVVGRKPEAPEPLKIKYKWVRDYDKDNYGLVIYLGEGDWPIRLYLNSAPGYTK